MASLESALASAAAAGASDGFYVDLRDGFAKDMVAEFKTGDVVLVKPSAVQGADRLNAFAGTTLRTARNAIVMGYPLDKIDGDNILFSDRRVLIDAAGFSASNTPAGDDQVEIDGRLHALVSLQQVPAAGVAVIYVLQARTGGQ